MVFWTDTVEGCSRKPMVWRGCAASIFRVKLMGLGKGAWK